MRSHVVLPGILLGLLVAPASHVLGQTQQLPMQLTSPKAGAVVSGIVPITVEAPEDTGIVFLVFGVDDSRPVSTNTRPFACSWDTSAYLDGPHFIFAEAYGAGGILARVGPVRVTVRNHLPTAQAIQPPGLVAAGVLPVEVHTPAPVVKTAGARSGGVEPSVSLNGNAMDIPVRIVQAQALVPIRPLVQRMDGSVAWNGGSRVATAWWRSQEVQLTVGSFVAVLNGDPVRLWRAPSIREERMVLPARGCAQLFDLSVAWDALRRVIRLGFAPAEESPVTTVTARRPA